MQISRSSEDGVTVICLDGRLDAVAAPEVQRAFTDIVAANARSVLVDLSGVEYVSSGGIRAIVVLYKGLERNGGTLKLCGLTPFVADVFEITNLRTMLDICPTRQAGIDAFKAASNQAPM